MAVNHYAVRGKCEKLSGFWRGAVWRRQSVERLVWQEWLSRPDRRSPIF